MFEFWEAMVSVAGAGSAFMVVMLTYLTMEASRAEKKARYRMGWAIVFGTLLFTYWASRTPIPGGACVG